VSEIFISFISAVQQQQLLAGSHTGSPNSSNQMISLSSASGLTPGESAETAICVNGDEFSLAGFLIADLTPSGAQ